MTREEHVRQRTQQLEGRLEVRLGDLSSLCCHLVLDLCRTGRSFPLQTALIISHELKSSVSLSLLPFGPISFPQSTRGHFYSLSSAIQYKSTLSDIELGLQT